MAKIARATQKQFGSGAGTNQMAEFGSLAAGTPSRFTGATITPATIQALSNYLNGWFSAILGGNSPTIEDMNSLCYLFAYQLGYLLQTGVPEWDAGTTYYIGSYVSFGSTLYVSLTDNNLNNPVTSTANWATSGGAISTVSSTYTILQTDSTIRMSGTSGYTATLPAVASTPAGKRYTVKNVSSNGSQMTLKGNVAELIDGSNTVTLESSPTFESYTVVNNGTSWDVV